jgi:hypothetical protein
LHSKQETELDITERFQVERLGEFARRRRIQRTDHTSSKRDQDQVDKAHHSKRPSDAQGLVDGFDNV